MDIHSVNTNLLGAWKFGINDPTLFAWLIVVGYLVAAWYCWVASRSQSVEQSNRSGPLWLLMSFFMLFFGINKQLDLHVALVPKMEKTSLWSEPWSAAMIVVAVIGAMLVFAVAIMVLRILLRQPRRLKLSYMALASLLLLQAIRFSPFGAAKLLGYHILEQNETWLHLHAIEVLELTVLAAIIWAAKSSVDSRMLSQKIAHTAG